MELKRRMVFRGNAAAFGGRIVRPSDIVLEMPGASSLPVTGGRSISRMARTQFKDVVSFESATTLAEGLFDDLDGAVALSNHLVREDTLTSSTRAHAEIRELVVGSRQRLRVKRLSAELLARSPAGSGEPPIALGDCSVDGLQIDGFKVKVDIERDVFQRCDTYSKLLAAADQPEFSREYRNQFFMATDFPGRPTPPFGRPLRGRETIYAAIVKKIDWDGQPNPRARIDNHTIVVEDFGTIFFGELLISSTSRRLTMMRLELGSDQGGSAGGPEVDINGSWS
jgi:hypothetical protein